MNYKGEQKALDPLQPQAIPSYLQDTYWWAYVHPNAVSFFERQWLVYLILWGNFARLRDALGKLHSYDVPECIEIAVEGGSAAYLKWIGESVD